MMRTALRLLAAALLVLPLLACETVGTKGGGGATVEEQGVEHALTPEEEAARTRGLQGAGAFQGHPLDNPASPLFKRVVYFDYDSSELTDEDKPIVEAHAAYLAQHPGASVTLEGNTDERGSREYNLGLGERRALAVRRMMLLLGAGPDQVRYVSYGEERPAAPGHDESAWRLNRRVEINYRAR